MPEYFIVSMRGVRRNSIQGCLNEFEDVLVESCEGTLILPRANPGGGRRVLGKRVGRPFEVEVPPREGPAERVLFLVAVSKAEVPGLLESIPDLRSHFDRVALYIFEPFISGIGSDQQGIRERIREFTDFYKKSIDIVFVSMSGGVAPLSEHYGVPVRFVPAACDVVRFGANVSGRMIDVNAYGRQDPKVSETLERRFNAPSSGRFYYHTGDSGMRLVPHPGEQRRLFWKLLTRSKIGLAYDPLVVDPQNRFPYSFIALRWFEMITAGCLVAGRRPTCPEMDELFPWEDSTVEVPEDPEEAADFLSILLEDSDRLEAAYRRNSSHAMAHHDWRHRIASMLDGLELPYPDPLQRSLESLASSTSAGLSSRSSGR